MSDSTARKSGRPRKFDTPSRVVTLTLPEETLRILASIDDDRAKAIVQAAKLAVSLRKSGGSPVELIEVAPNLAMLTVPYCESLDYLPDLSLVEIGPDRHLLVLEAGTPLAQIEVAIMDRIETLASATDKDKGILERVLDKIRSFRRTNSVDKAEVLLFRYSFALTGWAPALIA